jgi:ABC-type Fe3+-siderophore transport system permease subunit
MGASLTAQNLSFAYDGRPVLKEVSLAVDAWEFVGLIGADVSGLIGFVGLVAPHIVRLIIGPKRRYLLAAGALTGAAFLILIDILGRTVNRPEEIRLGIMTAVIGAPFFLSLSLRHYRAAGIG